MKKFNLFQETIVVNKSDLLNAINTKKSFSITINGDVLKDEVLNDEILIYFKKYTVEKSSSILKTQAFSIQNTLGKNYQVTEDGEQILIKAFSSWQEIININTKNASYDDTTADGVAEFSNKSLEEIGWNATEFDINYRSLVELIEKNCSGILLCIEQEEPYQFSGLGFISDNLKAKEVMFNYCKKEIQNLIDTDKNYALDILSQDEKDTLAFFNI